VAREPHGQPAKLSSGFREDVIAGLSLPRKSLPPKYFYDAAGSRLFERICRLREYYLTRAELSLTRAHIAAIARFAARGGTLIQDILDEVGTTVEHRVKEPRFAIAHDVWLTTGSLLERAMRERLEDGEACAVNSRHHQAPKDLGEGLIVSATAPDGVIEAIEDSGRRFCLGVQWHPEEIDDLPWVRRLFAGFAHAAAQ